MSHVRFHHVFLTLLTLCVISVFFVPRYPSVQKSVDRLRAPVRFLFVPVSAPTRKLSGWTYNRLNPPRAEGTRNQLDLEQENDRLRNQVVYLDKQLEILKRLNEDRTLLGSLRELCTPVAVVGGDGGLEESLLLNPMEVPREMDNLPVLYSAGGLVGRVDRIGSGLGPSVLLLTNPRSHVDGSFVRFSLDANNKSVVQTLPSAPVLVDGRGKGEMVISRMPMRDVKEAGIQLNDWVVLNDNNWPEVVQGVKIGKVVLIEPRPDAQQFALIHLEPTVVLSRLSEVMVLTKGK